MSKKSVKMKVILETGKRIIGWNSVGKAYHYLDAIRENQIVDDDISKDMARRTMYWITLLHRIPHSNSIKLDEHTELSLEVI